MSAASRCSAAAGWGPESPDGWCDPHTRFARLPSPGARSAKDRVLAELALQARGRTVAWGAGRREEQLQRLGSEAQHRTAGARVPPLPADATVWDGVPQQ